MPTLDLLQLEIDRLFDDLTGREEEGAQPAMWMPRTDISETEDAYVIRMDMPGLSREDVKIELQEGRLRVSGERKIKQEEKGETFRRVERMYGRFFRSFALPEASDTEHVQARLENGVLTIEVPKREEAKRRRIQIEGDATSTSKA